MQLNASNAGHKHNTKMGKKFKHKIAERFWNEDNGIHWNKAGVIHKGQAGLLRNWKCLYTLEQQKRFQVDVHKQINTHIHLTSFTLIPVNE